MQAKEEVLMCGGRLINALRLLPVRGCDQCRLENVAVLIGASTSCSVAGGVFESSISFQEAVSFSLFLNGNLSRAL